MFPPLHWIFQGFFFSLPGILGSLKTIMFLNNCPACALNFLSNWFGVYINLEEILSLLLEILLLFLSLFFFWYSNYVCAIYFIVVLQFSNIVLFKKMFFFLLSVLEVSIVTSSHSDSFLNHVQSTTEILLKVLFLQQRFMLTISFLFFHRISIHLNKN